MRRPVRRERFGASPHSADRKASKLRRAFGFVARCPILYNIEEPSKRRDASQKRRKAQAVLPAGIPPSIAFGLRAEVARAAHEAL
jgi:hypothetical protein